MMMLCWFYCVDFAKLLYFASAPVLFIASLFVLKRGVRGARQGLRTAAFIMMFVALIKICIFDVRMVSDNFLCGIGEQLSIKGCNKSWQKMLELGALLLLVLGSFGLFQMHRFFLRIKQPTTLTPDDVNLRFWANLCLVSTIGMVVWQCAPWAGYLTIGRIPALFIALPWQYLAIFNLVLLLFVFWKAESCNWNYDVRKRKEKMAHLNQTWTAKDTLWMTVFIYLITIALSYVAHDVLTQGGKLPPV